MSIPFWQNKSLSDMTDAEWESLCDGCGRCCLHKLEDQDTGEIFYTNVACRLLEIQSCRCGHYTERFQLEPGCVNLREKFAQLHWLPETCAYGLVARGEPLPWWHPLVSGSRETVHRAGVSVRSFAITKKQVKRLEAHVLPGRSLGPPKANGGATS